MGHVLACHRIPVKNVMNKGGFPARYIEALEQNQKIASCCRHPEDHDIEAWKSNENEQVPDVYKFICTCGRVHTRFCVGREDKRPLWTADGTVTVVTIKDPVKEEAVKRHNELMSNLTPEQQAKVQQKFAKTGG